MTPTNKQKQGSSLIPCRLLGHGHYVFKIIDLIDYPKYEPSFAAWQSYSDRTDANLLPSYGFLQTTYMPCLHDNAFPSRQTTKKRNPSILPSQL